LISLRQQLAFVIALANGRRWRVVCVSLRQQRIDHREIGRLCPTPCRCEHRWDARLNHGHGPGLPLDQSGDKITHAKAIST
jgi:hypothetical protein